MGLRFEVPTIFKPYPNIIWLVVWNIWIIFPHIGNNNPNYIIFFRGVGIPPTRYHYWIFLLDLRFHVQFQGFCVTFWLKLGPVLLGSLVKADDTSFPLMLATGRWFKTYWNLWYHSFRGMNICKSQLFWEQKGSRVTQNDYGAVGKPDGDWGMQPERQAERKAHGGIGTEFHGENTLW